MKKYILFICICFSFLFLSYPVIVQGQVYMDQRPNIILIISDDMGYSDLGCYGSRIHTPNLDSLAMNGLRYTQFYNMDHCCPSRAALMTGLYPHQTGLGWMVGKDFQLPGYTNELNNHCVTIAEVLKQAGYHTYMTGKWHLSHNTKADGPKYNWPLQRGFEKFYGMITGGGNYYDPPTLCRGNTLITPANDSDYQPDQYYFTNAISDHSVRFIKTRKEGKPFFMYIAYTAAHWPMQAPEETIAQYKGEFDAGWNELRRQRFRRQKELGVIDSSTTLSPVDTRPWSEENDKEAMARRMETYAAMITIMDEGIGDIMAELKKEGIFNNTVILYLQDNGGNAEGVGYGNGPEGTQKTIAEDPSKLQPLGINEIQNEVFPKITHNGAISIMGKKVMAGPENTYLAYLKPWANLSNTPFRKYKNFTYEGGIATPLIVHWPEGIHTERGAIRKQISHEIDIMPTLVQLAHAQYPAQYQSHNITPVSGVSLVPTFTDDDLKPRAIYWAHQANRAMRMGKWKIVSGAELHGPYGQWKTYTSFPWQLYNMVEDRSELKDLSGQYPKIVEQMESMWEEWAYETNVYPMPWKKAPPPEASYYMSTPWKFSNYR